jgi:8-oxo-dGTP pyrophosphatase MutT (NUDIX family)
LVFEVERIVALLNGYPQDVEAKAAVALILKLGKGELQALLVRRIGRPKDPWSGQIALPGGKREIIDKDLMQTVMRETFEETSIDLKTLRFLGVMHTFQSSHRPEMKVLPFVFLASTELSVTLNNNELESFFWIPLEELAKKRARVKFDFGEFPAFIVRNLNIWGLTYRILETLITRLET